MITCPSTIHAEDGEQAPEARFGGTFRPPWWPAGMFERVTYCLRCAAMMSSVRYFTLDEPSAEVEAWIEAKRLSPWRVSEREDAT